MARLEGAARRAPNVRPAIPARARATATVANAAPVAGCAQL